MPQAALIRPATLHICRARITRLAAAGTPLAGATSQYVTKHIQSVDRSVVSDDGERREILDGCEGVDAEYQAPDRFRGFEFSVEFTREDPRLFEIMTGMSLIMDTSTAPVPVGYNHPTAASPKPHVAFEIWSDAQESGIVSDKPYIRRIYPDTTWRIDDTTYETDFSTVTLIGRSRENPGWGIGLGDQGGTIDANGATLFTTVIPADSAGAFVAVP